jgi:hypothetical protein
MLPGVDHCTSLHEASLQVIGNRLSARLFAWPSICPDSEARTKFSPHDDKVYFSVFAQTTERSTVIRILSMAE